MSVGGPTWGTAGTLDLGSGNTFDLADATETGTVQPWHHAWWTFTVSVHSLVTITASDLAMRAYTGDDEADKVLFAFTAEPLTFLAFPGTTYHIVVGTFNSGDTTPATYQVTYTHDATLTASPWNDSLQDDPDNFLIISEGDLVLANPNEWFRSSISGGPDALVWRGQVLRGGQRRLGDYSAFQTLGSPYLVTAAFSCVVSHADYGDDDVQLWNTSTTDANDHGPPNCRVLPAQPALADVRGTTTSTRRTLDHRPGGQLVAPEAVGRATGPSWFLWHLPVRDNLPPWGTLFDFSLDPVDYGYPPDAVVEWEDDTPDLLGIELADGDPLTSGAAPYANKWTLNGRWAPRWESGASTEWWMGDATEAPTATVPNRPWMTWLYEDGGPADGDWQLIDDSVGWDGHDWTENYERVAEVSPTETDSVVVAWPTVQDTVEADESRFARLAVKYKLQARRFRFVYAGSSSVIRQYPRDDNRGWGSGTRLYPPTKANRTVGGIQ